MKFNQSKCTILHLTNPDTIIPHNSQFGANKVESGFTRKDNLLLDSKLNRIQQYALETKKANCILSCTNKHIARSSRQGFLHPCSMLKATSEFNVEFPSTK